VCPYFTGRKVTEIDRADVEEFSASKLEAGLSPKSVREAVSVLSLVMQLAVNSKVRRDNPAAGHRLPVRQRKIHQGDVLSMEQAHRLVGTIPGPYKSAVWMLMLTGMRPAELCGLRVSSVDLLRGEVRVTESLLPVHKFGDQPYHRNVTGPTKTEAGDRGIPIPRWLADDLSTMLAEGSPLPHRICPVARSMRANRPWGEVGEVDATVIAYADTPPAGTTVPAGASFKLATTDALHTDELDATGPDGKLVVDGAEVLVTDPKAPAPEPHEHSATARTRLPTPTRHQWQPTFTTLLQDRCTPKTPPQTARMFPCLRGRPLEPGPLRM
jgi:hypothetical protein